MRTRGTRKPLRRIITSARRVFFAALIFLSALCGQAAADCDADCLTGFNRCKSGCPADDEGVCAAGCFVQSETCFDACKVSVAPPAEGEPAHPAQDDGADERLRQFTQARAAEEQRKFAQAKEEEERQKAAQTKEEEERQKAVQAKEEEERQQATQAKEETERQKAAQAKEEAERQKAAQAKEEEERQQAAQAKEEQAEETEEDEYQKAFVLAARTGDCTNFCRSRALACADACRAKGGENQESCVSSCVYDSPTQCHKACTARQRLEQEWEGRKKD